MTKANRRNEMWHWTNDEIGVAVQSWLWTHELNELNSWLDSSVGQSVRLVGSNPTQANFL